MARSLLVVPTFSSLSVDLYLSLSGERLVKHTATFEASLTGTDEQVFDNIEKEVSFQVTVDWMKFPSYPVPEPSWLGTSHPLSLNVRGKTPRLESLSVYVGRRVDKALALYGNIEVSDDSGIRVDLSDDENNVYLKGYLSWNFVNNLSHELWFNNRKCSLIRGDGGFATIQYTIFSNPTQAKIKASIIFKSSTSCNVYGKIVAAYGGHDYATKFEQKYYKSILLHRTKNTPLRLENGSMIPLLKSCVVVPSEAPLVVSLYLSSKELDQGFLNETIQIKYGEKCSVLEAEHATLEFLVDWMDD